jgi:hypothetical protein
VAHLVPVVPSCFRLSRVICAPPTMTLASSSRNLHTAAIACATRQRRASFTSQPVKASPVDGHEGADERFDVAAA